MEFVLSFQKQGFRDVFIKCQATPPNPKPLQPHVFYETFLTLRCSFYSQHTTPLAFCYLSDNTPMKHKPRTTPLQLLTQPPLSKLRKGLIRTYNTKPDIADHHHIKQKHIYIYPHPSFKKLSRHTSQLPPQTSPIPTNTRT